MRRGMIFAWIFVFSIIAAADTWTDPNTGLTWTYQIIGTGEASIGPGNNDISSNRDRAIPISTSGEITIPSEVEGCTVTRIGSYAFYGYVKVDEDGYSHKCKGCEFLSGVTIPPSVTSVGDYAFSRCSSLSRIQIPNSVTNIGIGAFGGCSALTNVVLSANVRNIGDYAFRNCGSLESVLIPRNAASIGEFSFSGCAKLGEVSILNADAYVASNAFSQCFSVTNVTVPGKYVLADIFPDSYGAINRVTITPGSDYIIAHAFEACMDIGSVFVPESVVWIEDKAFFKCASLTNVIYGGDAPYMGCNVYDCTPRRLITRITEGTIGWDGGFTTNVPSVWNDRRISSLAAAENDVTPSDGSAEVPISFVVVSNIVVHYVCNSVESPMAAPISIDTGIVNVMTEIKGGNVAIPASWADNYPAFESKFGTDFSAALTKVTGKFDAAGSPMMVWQDFVAGTDPTDENSVFRASVTMVDEKPVVSYTPELSTDEKAKRKYTTYGKVKLQDAEWVEVPDDHESDYNFFKVTVEMK